KIKPDVYIVGEIWDNTTFQIPYAEGFTSLFNFDLAYSILESVNYEKQMVATVQSGGWALDSASSFVDAIAQKTKSFKAQNPGYVDAIFLSNHDQNRVMSVLNNQKDKAKLAASILLTLPGIPYIYYGEEIGMSGKKPDPHIREPFLWKVNEKDSLRTRWIDPIYSTDRTVLPLAKQQENQGSLLHHYQDLIAVRKQNEALSEGELSPYQSDNNQLITFKRSTNKQKILIIHNLSAEQQRVKIPVYEKIIMGSENWVQGGLVNLPVRESIILEL
ncbi:MAG: alpha-amylase family glycosyl hydrolase, partial [Fulvivirga sp.]|nr:alpha-amylase family glycosyl hydrolase [Fulvivirga sp.]